jgi:hypothetical protein
VDRNKVMALDDTTWVIEAENVDLRRVMVAIACQGFRIGAWWPRVLGDIVNPTDGLVPPPYKLEEIAAMIRWMHAPVLSGGYVSSLGTFARAHAAEVMAAWLLDDGLPQGFRHRSTGEEWLTALRHLLTGWHPTPIDARLIVETLSRDTLDDALLACVPRLVRLDPVLMGHVVRGWLEDVVPGDPGQMPVAEQLKRVKRLVAGLNVDANEAAVSSRQRELLGQAARVMQVDLRFCDGTAQRAVRLLYDTSLKDVDLANLDTSLAVAPFRDYLGMRIVDALTEMAKGRMVCR